MELNPVALQFTPFAGVSITNQTGTTFDAQGLDIAGHAACDMGSFAVPFKCDVVMPMIEIRENVGAGTTPTGEFKFDRRHICGSDTGRGDGDVGDINIGVTGVSAAGEVAYDLAGAGVTLEPGMEVVLQCISAPSGSGHVWPHLLVRYRPETRTNLAALQETT